MPCLPPVSGTQGVSACRLLAIVFCAQCSPTGLWQHFAISPGYVAWLEDDVLVRVSRTDPTAETRRTVGYQIRSIAVTDTATAWVSNVDSPPTVWTAAGGGEPAAAGTTWVEDVVAFDGGFVLSAGTTMATSGLHYATPGVAGAEPLHPAEGQAFQPRGVVLSPGRVAAGTWDGAQRALLGDAYADAGEAVSDSPYGSLPYTFDAEEIAASGDWTVLSASTSEGYRVYDGTTHVRTVKFRGSIWPPQVSGPRVLTESETDSQVVDLVTGTTTTWRPGAALFGPYLAYAEPDGRVLVRDLRLPVSAANPRTVRAAGAVPGCTMPCATFPRGAMLTMSGDWVGYLLGATYVVTNVKTGIRRELPESAAYRGHLDGGALAWTDSVDDLMYVEDFTAGTRHELGAGLVRGLSDGLVAWTSHTGGLRITVSPVAPAAPRLLGTAPVAAFSPDGDTRLDVWKPVFDFSGAVAWTLTIRAGTTVVRTLTGIADHGSVRPAWDGKQSSGATVGDGTYSWQLTGASLVTGLPLAGPDGTSAVTGTVAVRKADPTSRIVAPAVSTDTSAGYGVLVSWSSPMPGVVWDTAYRVRTLQRNGTYADGPLTTWKTGLTTTRLTFNGQQDRTYRFYVRARDNAGNVGPWAAATTVFPVDDRSSALRYGGSWATQSAAGRFLNTLRATNSANATVTLTSRTSAFRVIGERCPTCGKFAVYIDGRLIGTYDSYYGSTRARQVLFARALTFGQHTIQVKALGTAGRPRIAVDAIAATH